MDFVERQLAPGQIPVLVAHNLKGFDHEVMSTEFRECGLEWPEHWHWFDTLRLAFQDAKYKRGFRSQVSDHLQSKPAQDSGAGLSDG